MYIHKINVLILFTLLPLISCTTYINTSEIYDEVEQVKKEESDNLALEYAISLIFVEVAVGRSNVLRKNRGHCEKCYFPETTELALRLIGKLKTSQSKTIIANLVSVQLDGVGSEFRSELLGENNNELWDVYLKSNASSLNKWCVSNFEKNKLLINEYMPDITSKDICWDRQTIEKDLNYLRAK